MLTALTLNDFKPPRDERRRGDGMNERWEVSGEKERAGGDRKRTRGASNHETAYE